MMRKYKRFISMLLISIMLIIGTVSPVHADPVVTPTVTYVLATLLIAAGVTLNADSIDNVCSGLWDSMTQTAKDAVMAASVSGAIWLSPSITTEVNTYTSDFNLTPSADFNNKVNKIVDVAGHNSNYTVVYWAYRNVVTGSEYKMLLAQPGVDAYACVLNSPWNGYTGIRSEPAGARYVYKLDTNTANAQVSSGVLPIGMCETYKMSSVTNVPVLTVTAGVSSTIDYPFDEAPDYTGKKVEVPPWPGLLDYVGKSPADLSMEDYAGDTPVVPAVPTDVTGFWSGLWQWLQSLLSAIQGLPASMIAAITGLFVVPADVNIDLKPMTDILQNLKDKFPFCLPFIIYDFFDLLDAPPTPIVYTVTLDLGAFGGIQHMLIDCSPADPFMSIIRMLELMGFIILLVINTKRIVPTLG